MTKTVMALVDACRTPIRRQIMILAEEAKMRDETVSAKRTAEKLGESVGSVSYHFKVLAKAGALKETGGEQKRGAWQKNYVPSEAFQATMTDTVALDRIAELIEDLATFEGISEGSELYAQLGKLSSVIRATGRPVEA